MAEPKITRRKLTDYQPDPRNANQGTERGVYMLDKSIESVGPGRSLVASADDFIPIGNHAQQAFIDAGFIDVVEVETDGKTVIVHKRSDWKNIADPIVRKAALYDNRSSEVGLAWDAERILADLNSGVDLSALWHEDELDALLAGMDGYGAPAGDDPGAQIDRAEELREQWQTERGQVWDVPSVTVPGRAHRVMCGDSTSAEDVARLLNGLEPRLMVTDQPYGVEYDAAWRNKAFGNGNRAVGRISNDDEVNWSEAYRLAPSKVAYCWHADRHASSVELAMEEAGYKVRAQIIWAKRHFVIGRGHYHTRHEPCWYAVRENCNADWIGPSNAQTVWDDIALDERSQGGHSTQKPVECMARPIRNHAGDVYDPFLGSGTTLVAAEQTGRIGYGMELEPKYVAVTLERLAGMGLDPRLSEQLSSIKSDA